MMAKSGYCTLFLVFITCSMLVSVFMERLICSEANTKNDEQYIGSDFTLGVSYHIKEDFLLGENT